MTQVAEPRADREAPATIERVHHWIGGRVVAGHVRPQRPGLRPGHGRHGREVDFASVEEVDAAVAAAKRRLPGLARDVALEAHRDHVPHPQPGRRSTAASSRRS